MKIVKNPLNSSCKCFAFSGRDMAVRSNGEQLTFSDVMLIKDACKATVCFEEKDNDLCAIGIVDKDSLPSGYKLVPLRTFFFAPENGAEDIYRASRAKGLTSWLENTRYCCKCGSELVIRELESALECPNCGMVAYPRINPCIIVLVHKDKQILLAKHVQRNQNIYACLAGFIESGENAEHAVAREIYEETGLKVKNIKYFGSQSWPFPSQLMLGFTAEYESGEIKVQEDEIADAQWYSVNECPATPSPGSIAYELIEDAKRNLR